MALTLEPVVHPPSAALILHRSYYITLSVEDFHLLNSVMVVFLPILFGSIAVAVGVPTVYDQRQSGKTNVRVELKDAVIIAVGDGEFGGDYDYTYDYSDLTIKPSPPSLPTSVHPVTTAVPPKSTTPKATTTAAAAAEVSTSTVRVNITQNAAVLLEAENNSIIFPASVVKPGNSSSEPVKIKPSTGYKPDQIPVLVLQEANRPNKFLPVKTVDKQFIPMQNQFEKTSAPSTISAKELPMRHCSPGFFLDNHNRCKRIHRPTRERPQLPIGLRFDHRPLTRS